jgi:RNA recognition motif-containing protein
MTRDFLVEFDCERDVDKAIKILKDITFKGEKLFLPPEKRNNSLFLTFGYSKEIKKDDFLIFDSKHISLYENLVFVALKNGKHSPKGYLFCSKKINRLSLKGKINVKDIFKLIKDYLNQ